ncbi:helix-turn-helix domain-containing protein [Phaeobacter inhibens]|uniref:helix-turn-helix domain-containing protein n=1 Tax=Phaeobacter inhibens TaxID=221822 RepID=UPI002491CFE6|nr:helix-turn-helix transcriptional regulator [Phaeobacter inhibens]
MSDQLKRNIGLRVKAARTQKGLTQPQLAEAIDKAFETISNIERGKTAPNFSTLHDIANVLGLPMREFFDVDEENLTDARQRLLIQLNTMIAQMDDRQLNLLLKLGQVLLDDGAADE